MYVVSKYHYNANPCLATNGLQRNPNVLLDVSRPKI
jgi:hypothetical protein